MKQRFTNKLISLATAYSLLYSALVCTNNAMGEQTENKICIPHNLGTISSRWNPDSPPDKFVIHIKDIHCEYGIQKSISGILEMLIRQNGIQLIGLEGANGEVDTSAFRSFPDKQAKQQVCDNFLKKGILTGAENLSITKGDSLNFNLFGVEDQRLYIDNLNYFRNTIFASQKTEFLFRKLESAIDNAKKSIYPPELYKFDAKSAEFSSDKMEFDTWSRVLNMKALEYNISLSGYPNFRAIMEVFKLEKKTLNYNLITAEKQVLTGELKTKLPEEEFVAYAKNEIKYNIGKISPSEYFESIAKYIDSKKYPNLNEYLRLGRLRKRVDQTKLFEESLSLEKEIKKALCVKLAKDSLSENLYNAVTVLDQISESARMFSKINSIKLNDSELAILRTDKDKLNPASVIGLLKKLCVEENINADPEIFSAQFLESIRTPIDSGMKFYGLADKRSKIMADNLISKMESEKDDRAVIVTGGFHSSYIENYLRGKHIAYITITPNSTATDNAKYISLMTDTALDLTSRVTDGLHIAFPVLFSAMVSNSTYFESIKKEMAQSLISFKNISVTQYRAQLKDDFSRKMFNKLLLIAGLDLAQTQQMPIGRLIDNLSPDTISDYILTYDNNKITSELVSAGVKASDLSFEDKKLFADYLISLLDIAIQVTPGSKSLGNYLDKIIAQSNTAQFTVLHNSAYWRLKNSLSAVKTVSNDDSLETKVHKMAFKLANEIAKAGLINLPQTIQESDIRLGNKSLYGFHSGEIEDRIWFEFIVNDVSGSEKRFFVKSARYADFEVMGHRAVKAIGKLDYKYHYSTDVLDDYAGFHISDYVGDLTADQFDPTDENVLDFAGKLGEAVAIAFALGLVDRKLDNFRVAYKDGKPASVINIDLTGALASSKLPLSLVFEPITSFVKKAKKQEVDKNTVNNIMLSFLMGFQDSIFDIQDYYTANKDKLTGYPGLADSPRWNKALERMNPDITDPIALLREAVDYLNSQLDFNISSQIIDYKPEGVSEPQRVQEFVEKQQFTRFNAEISYNSRVYVNKNGTVFLKREGGAVHRIKNRIGIWLKKPKSFIRFVGNYAFTLLGASALIIAAHRLGGIVPPMYTIGPKDPVNIRANGITEQVTNAFFQQKIHITVKELFKELAEKGDTQSINRIIDNYLKSQVTMWKRGAFDRDLNFFNNYGIDNLDTLEVKCFDIGNLTDNLLAGIIVTVAKPGMDDIIKQLIDILPAENVRYFKKEFARVFSASNLMSLWNTEYPVPADRIYLNRRVGFFVPGNSIVGNQESFLSEPEMVTRFITGHKFKPFTKQEAATDMELLISSDSNYVLKTSGTMSHTFKSYFKAVTYMADKLTKPIRKSNMLKLVSLASIAGLLFIYPQLFYGTVFVLLFSSISLSIIIGLTKSPIGGVILGPLLPILTPHKIKVAYARLGGLVPPMYKFKLNDNVKIGYAGRTFAVKEGLIQKKAKYTLLDVMKKLGKEGNVSEINRVIDKFFEMETMLWERGVFDIDFLSFERNYGLNDLDKLDIQLFDLGGISPYFLRGFMGITYEGKIGRKFMFDELKELVPAECVEHFTRKFKQTFTVLNLLRHWRKQKPVPLAKVDLNDFPAQQYDMPQPVINGLSAKQSAAVIDMVNNFLLEAGLENEFHLGDKIIELFENCLQDGAIPELNEIMKVQLTPKMFVRIITSKNFHIYKPLMQMSLGMMQISKRFDIGGVFVAAVESLVISHIESMSGQSNPKVQDKINHYNHLIEESI